MSKLLIGVSSCLLGNRVRYDGNHRLDRYITENLGNFFQYIHFCPEVECGLGVPRETMQLVGDPASAHLLTTKTRIDHTERLNRWAERTLNTMTSENLCGFIFKTKSPSCALADAKVFTTGNGPVKRSSGLFAAAFTKHFPLVPTIDNGRLHNEKLRENFFEKVCVLARWHQYLKKNPNCLHLIRFHQNHKYLIMSHSPQKQQMLGKMLSNCGNVFSSQLQNQYIKQLMETLSLPATLKKNINVLQHIAGYLKKQLSSDQKKELQEIIENYQRGLLPLIVPLTLLKHYVRLFNEPFLSEQIYLNAHPAELMLKNELL